MSLGKRNAESFKMYGETVLLTFDGVRASCAQSRNNGYLENTQMAHGRELVWFRRFFFLFLAAVEILSYTTYYDLSTGMQPRATYTRQTCPKKKKANRFLRVFSYRMCARDPKYVRRGDFFPCPNAATGPGVVCTRRAHRTALDPDLRTRVDHATAKIVGSRLQIATLFPIDELLFRRR